MEPKRRTAASIFMEQNAIQQEAELDDRLLPEQAEFAKDMGPAPLLAAASAPGGAPMPQQSYQSQAFTKAKRAGNTTLKTSEELQLEKEPIRVRETGVWIWKRVIVPPNAYVVHTRMGRENPVTLGLGCSFRMNPNTDAYLVVPAAMQTIGIVANCISKEKQGINILAYVQWQINDFSVAYKKLDFSDSHDPLGIVNAQLREQAEAAIKDKIATMSVEEVLTDKEPIIEELTTRLKMVAEGRNQNNQGDVNSEGLGIKIVTVQIKEALVSSQRLWENLQAPFRFEQEKKARISYLLSQDEVRQKELETRRLAETSEAETLVEIERIKQGTQTEALQTRLNEEATRFTIQQETARQKIQLEEQTTVTRRESEQRLQSQLAEAEQAVKLAEIRREQTAQLEQARLDAEAKAREKALQVEQALQELAEETRLAVVRLQNYQQQLERETAMKRQEAEFNQMVQSQKDALSNLVLEANLGRERQQTSANLELEEARSSLKLTLQEREAGIARLHQEVRNLINERDLSSRLVERLPELASHMPEIKELKILQTGSGEGAFDALTAFLARTLAIAQNLGLSLPTGKPTENENGQAG